MVPLLGLLRGICLAGTQLVTTINEKHLILHYGGSNHNSNSISTEEYVKCLRYICRNFRFTLQVNSLEEGGDGGNLV